MENKLAFIGDIHGDITALEALLKKIPNDRTLVFVGDYINHGNYSNQVIERLIQIKEEGNAKFIMGNHEFYLLQYLKEDVSFYDYAIVGGIATIKSYIENIGGRDLLSDFKESIPESHITFLNELILYYETDKIFCSHSGINYSLPESREFEDLVMNNNLLDQKGKLNKTIVCGHYVQRNGVPYNTVDLVCIDTGCGSKDGPLTAFMYPEREVIQAYNIR
jgi:serine/threonine protein phosphatase 1